MSIKIDFLLICLRVKLINGASPRKINKTTKQPNKIHLVAFVKKLIGINKFSFGKIENWWNKKRAPLSVGASWSVPFN